MADRSRYGVYTRTRLPRQKKTLGQYGEKDDTGKWYRCWNCGFLCNIDRDKLDQGEHGRGGIVVEDNLSLLLHMDGDNASTTFTDSSPSAHTVTANGNAQISTAQYKFSTASGLFDGTGDYLTLSDNADFDLSAGYWSIDFWVRGNWSGTGSEGIWFQRTDANNYFSLTMLKESAGYGASLSIYEDGSEVVSLSTGTPRITSGSWTHVQFSEFLNNYMAFINGVLVASTYDADRPADYTGSVYIGCTYAAGAAANYFNGYLDEVRVMKYVDHFSTFDVSTSAYSTTSYIPGVYYPKNISGCPLCGSTNYK